MKTKNMAKEKLAIFLVFFIVGVNFSMIFTMPFLGYSNIAVITIMAITDFIIIIIFLPFFYDIQKIFGKFGGGLSFGLKTHEKATRKQSKTSIGLQNHETTNLEDANNLKNQDNELNNGLDNMKIHNYQKAANHFKKHLEINPDDPDGLSSAGANLREMGNRKDAIPIQCMAFKLFNDQRQNEKAIAELDQIGISFRKLGFFNDARLIFYKIFKTINKIDDPFAYAKYLNSSGLVFIELGKFDKAILDFNESLKINQDNNNQCGITRNLTNLGFSHYHLKKYPIALKYFSDALQQSQEHNNQVGIAKCLYGIGLVYIKLGDYSNAIRSLEDAKEIAHNDNNKIRESKIWSAIAEIKKDKEDFIESKESYEKAINIQISLNDYLSLEKNYMDLNYLCKQMGLIEESKKCEILTQTTRKKLESMKFDYKWIREVNIQNIK